MCLQHTVCAFDRQCLGMAYHCKYPVAVVSWSADLMNAVLKNQPDQPCLLPHAYARSQERTQDKKDKLTRRQT